MLESTGPLHLTGGSLIVLPGDSGVQEDLLLGAEEAGQGVRVYHGALPTADVVTVAALSAPVLVLPLTRLDIVHLLMLTIVHLRPVAAEAGAQAHHPQPPLGALRLSRK